MSSRFNKFLLQACILLSCFTVICCNKNDKDDHPLPSGNYTFDKPGNYSDIRMFTKQGEVKDQQLIDQYKTKFAVHINPTASVSGSVDTFRIVDENTAQYIFRNRITNEVMAKDFVITKMDEYYRFQSKDTLRYGYTGGGDNLIINIGKFKPYYLLPPMPISTGYNNMVTTMQYYYASITDDGLVFPFLNIIQFATLTYQGQTYSSYYNVNRINNVFDEKFPLNTLSVDTILVQSVNLTYKRTAP